MRIEKVVVNSSPLIVLFRSGQADFALRAISFVYWVGQCTGYRASM